MAAQAQRAWWKTVGGIIIILAIILLILIVLTPGILSTHWGQSKIIQIANNSIPGQINAKSIKINWFGTQTIDGLELLDPEGNLVLSLDHFSVEYPLTTLLWKGLKPPFKADLKGLNAMLLRQEGNSSNLQQALGIPISSIQITTLPLNLKISDVEGEVNFTAVDEPLAVHLKGKAQSPEGIGYFDIQAVVEKGALPQSLQVLSAKVKDFPVEILEQFVAVKNPKLGSILLASIGKTFDLTLDQQKTDLGSDFQLHMQSPNMQADLAGLLTADKFVLQQPGKVTFNVTSELIHSLMDESSDNIFAQTAKFDLIINTLDFPLSDGNPSMDISIGSTPLSLIGLPMNSSLSLHDLNLKVSGNPLKESKFQLNADIVPHNTESSLGLAIGKRAALQMNGRVSFNDAWSVEKFQDLHSLRFSGNMAVDKLQIGKGGPNSHTALLNMNIPWEIDGSANLIKLIFKGQTSVFGQDSQNDLDGSFVFKNWIKGGKPDLQSADFIADANIRGLPVELLEALAGHEHLVKILGPSLDLKVDANIHGMDFAGVKLNFAIKSDQLAGQASLQTGDSISLNFDIRGQQKGAEGKKNDLILQGNLQNFLSKQGKINTSDMQVNLRILGQGIPAHLFCQVACLGKPMRMKLEALIGPFIDTQIEIQLQKMNGPILVNLEGPNGHIYLDGVVNKGVLTLKKPFQAEIVATPELGQSVLEEMIPILSGIVEAENKLIINIDPEGFAYPIGDDNFTNTFIDHMSVNLGKVHFNNQGHLGKIMAILKVNPQNLISVWFTPVYLSVHSGVIRLERFDMLAMDNFPIAAWGTINLPNDRIDMTIGLSGKSLQSALKFPMLDKSYMMQFPLRGPIGHASIDKTKVAARMAALAAAMTATPQGLVLGAVIGLASGTLTEDKPPAPTTKPFPWEEGYGSEEAESERPQEITGKNPLKSIQKGASNLINNIFH